MVFFLMLGIRQVLPTMSITRINHVPQTQEANRSRKGDTSIGRQSNNIDGCMCTMKAKIAIQPFLQLCSSSSLVSFHRIKSIHFTTKAKRA